jgi:hypothetical protein
MFRLRPCIRRWSPARVRVMDLQLRAGEDHAGHCGFLFPEFESDGDQCRSHWTNYMCRILAQGPDNAVIEASNLSNLEHQIPRPGYDGEATHLPADPRQGDLYV